jgi:hypothetical protein
MPTQSKCLVPFLVMLCFAATLFAQQNQVSSTANTAAASPVPRLIKFTGSLLDEQGRPMKSPIGVVFALYAQQSEGAALWMETQNVETDPKGNYTVLLGANSTSGVPADLFNSGEARWLGVQAERQPEQPRVLLVSVPYALKAGDAQTLGGFPPSAFMQTQGSGSAVLVPTGTSATATAATAPLSGVLAVTTPGLTSGTVPVADGASDIKNSQIRDNGTTVVVGSCTLAAGIKLDICGPTNIRGTLQLPATGTASAALGANSQPLDFLVSSFNSSPAPGAAVTQHFRWQAESVANNTPSPSGKLNLLFASGTGIPAETGLSISSKGILSFAPGQTIPTVTGNETVTGNFAAGGSVSGAAGSFAGNVAVNGDLNLPDTTSAKAGVISLGGTPFAHDFGVQNTFVGKNAGNLTTSGSGRNAAFGMSALQNNTTGAFNTASGFASLFSNTTGSSNTATGENALIFNTAGSSNTATGQFALGFNTTGSNNTALGVGAGSTATSANANMTGSNNTFIGYQSGPGTAVQLTNATAIGANAMVNCSNCMVLGDSTMPMNVGIGTPNPARALEIVDPSNTGLRVQTNLAGGTVASFGGNGNFQIDAPGKVGGRFTVLEDGRVGIGTSGPFSLLTVFESQPAQQAGNGTSPTTVLEISGGQGGNTTGTTGQVAGSGASVFILAGYGGRAPAGSTNGNGGSVEINSGGPGLGGGAAGTHGAVLLNRFGGNVGIGLQSPATALQVFGDIRVGTGSPAANGCLQDSSGGTIVGTCSSDARLKTSVRTFLPILDKLVRLQPVYFHWNAEMYPEFHFGSDESFGLIAQEAEKVLPELVTEDEKGFKAVKYHELPLLMLQAIRELKAENDSLQAQVKAQGEQHQQWEVKMSELRSEVQELRAQVLGASDSAQK